MSFYRTRNLIFLILTIFPLSLSASDKVLNWGGYISTYFTINDNALDIYSNHQYFVQTGFNLYLESIVKKDFRFFGELKYLYAPNAGGFVYNEQWVDHTHNYYLNEHFTYDNWNALLIERAYAEWMGRQSFNIRIGKLLLPFGIWNQDHGDPALTTIRPPNLIVFNTFPRAITGVEIYGSFFPTYDNRLKYHMYIANNESENSESRNASKRFSFGSRIESNNHFSDDFILDIGLSLYNGNRIWYVMAFEAPDFIQKTRIDRLINKTVLGSDIKIHLSRFLIQAELNICDVNAKKNYRDETLYQWYAQIEYNIEDILRPYFRYDYDLFDPNLKPIYFGMNSASVTWDLSNNPFIGKRWLAQTLTFGFNIRPIPEFIIKMEVVHFIFEKDLHVDDYNVYNIGITLAF